MYYDVWGSDSDSEDERGYVDPRRREVPSLQTIIRTKEIDRIASDPSSIQTPNQYTSYYRILEFIGRNKNLIEQAIYRPDNFEWMGAADSINLVQWCDALYATISKDPTHEKKPRIFLTEFDDFMVRGDEDYGIVDRPVRIKRWKYDFLSHSVYALVIPRSSGTRGMIKLNKYRVEESDPPKTILREMDCNIEIMKLKTLEFWEMSVLEDDRGSSGSTDEGSSTRNGNGRYKNLETSVIISGHRLIPNINETEWFTEELLSYRFEQVRSWIKHNMREEWEAEGLDAYKDPRIRGNTSGNLSIGYRHTGYPIMGGWGTSECYVPNDIHLFDFDPNTPPYEFMWVMRLAATFWRWQEKQPDSSAVSYSPNKPMFKQFYGMRGPELDFTGMRPVNYKTVQDALLDWMKSRQIPINDQQKHLLDSNRADYSVTRPDFRRRGRSTVDDSPLDTCTIQ